MSWSARASGTGAEVKAQVQEQVGKQHSRIADAVCELVDCAGTAAVVSLSASGQENGEGNISLNITRTKPVAGVPAK